MQRTTFLSLALITGLFLQPLPGLAEDQAANKLDKKDNNGSPHKGDAKPHGGRHDQKMAQDVVVSPTHKSRDQISNRSVVSASRSTDFAPQNGGSINREARQTFSRRTSQQQQTREFAVQGDHSNRYNGRWFSADSHHDWDQHTNHQWRNHDYRWYDGGWLIIDTSPGYVSTGSTGRRVQASLSQQGYYNGPIDGDIGSGSQRAIAHYQHDNGLQINGVIDGPLLVSLGLD